MNEQLNKIRKRLLVNLAVTWFLPLMIVILVRSIYQNDTIALAAAGVIPVMKTLIILIFRRRVDWIGVLGTIGFSAALAVSKLFWGSSLPLKLYHPAITGIIGLILVGSVVIGKPLLIIILKLFNKSGSERFKSIEARKQLSNITAVVGVVFIIEAVIHVIMAVTLSTVTYMSASRIVTLAGIVAIVASRKMAAAKVRDSERLERN